MNAHKVKQHCPSCFKYGSFTRNPRKKVNQGDVCDECVVAPPKKCLSCDFPHRQVGERCENCELEDITKESRVCVLCYGLFKLDGRPLQLCDDCHKGCMTPFKTLHTDWNFRPPQKRNVFK
jgi:hypothetical protein